MSPTPTSYGQFCNCGPSASEIRRYLPDLGDHIAAAMAELARDATPDRCDKLLASLDGARQLVSTLRRSLIGQGGRDAE